MPRKKQTRAGIKCEGCGRFLDADGYGGFDPKPDTPPDKIHYVDHSSFRGASFCCPTITCGHYTVVRDTRHNKVIQ